MLKICAPESPSVSSFAVAVVAVTTLPVFEAKLIRIGGRAHRVAAAAALPAQISTGLSEIGSLKVWRDRERRVRHAGKVRGDGLVPDVDRVDHLVLRVRSAGRRRRRRSSRGTS